MARLEAELRQSQPTAQVPSDLHNSILCAVRSAGKPARPESVLPRGRWAVAAVFAVLLVVCAWWGIQRPEVDDHFFTGVDLAMQHTQNIPAQASAAMLAPLSQELEFLNRDFHGAVDFVVASVP